MKNYLSKLLLIFLLLIAFIFISAKSYATSIMNDLSNNIFRLHIIANSDSDEDQNLKLKVRDQIISYIKTLTKDCENKDEVVSITSDNLKVLANIAKNTIIENGYNYNVTVEIRKLLFSDKILW
jgi:stage II sporulation protein R